MLNECGLDIKVYSMKEVYWASCILVREWMRFELQNKYGKEEWMDEEYGDGTDEVLRNQICKE